jgi:hypothetical protein
MNWVQKGELAVMMNDERCTGELIISARPPLLSFSSSRHPRHRCIGAMRHGASVPRKIGFWVNLYCMFVKVPRSLTVLPSLNPLLWFDSCSDRRWLKQAYRARSSYLGGDGKERMARMCHIPSLPLLLDSAPFL